MDLFSITCTTCKSRLRVREQSAIGQILACPKCGGMVMVKAPEGWVSGQPVPPPRVEPPAGATAVVEVKRKDETSSDSDFDAIDDILANAPPKPKLPVVSVAPDAPGLARPRFAGNPAHAPSGGSSIGKAGATVASAAGGATPATAELAAAKGQKSEPTAEGKVAGVETIPDFQPPPAARTWRYYALLAASVLAGIGLAIAVVAATAGFFRGDPKQAVQVPAANPITSPGHQGSTEEPAATTPAVEPTASPTTQPSTVTPPSPTTVNPQPTVPTTTTTAPPILPTPAVAPGPPPAAASPFDDLLKPDQDPLQPKTVAPATKPAAPPPEPAPDEPPAKPLVPRPEPREVDVAARLADQIASLETAGTPLADFLQVMSDLSTIPITLEPDGLPLAQASATSPVVLKLTSTTIDGALATGLKQLGLEHVPLEGQLLVRLIEPAEMPVLSYPHKDLTGGDEAAAADLGELIQAVVDPPSWTLGDAGGASLEVSDTLKIKQRRANHAQIFLLCEKLRTARKLPYASKYPPALFQLDSRTRQATPRLKSPVSLNFHQTMPLVKILRELEQAAVPQNAGARGLGLRILVDWRDIAAGGWNPDAVTTLVAEGESLALALQKLLEPMELAWRVVDGQTIQVVSPVTLASRCEVELFSVGDLLKDDPTAEQLVANIRETLGEQLFRDQGGPCELRFDAASQCLVALLPQPKQQDLEVFLMTMRKPM